MILPILFSLVLGGIHYDVVKDCKDLGHTYFPLDDSKEHRRLYLCTCYPDETKEVVTHELLHICTHPHMHRFKIPEEMNEHLHVKMYTEEEFVSLVAPCVVDDEDKLFSALRAYHVRIH